MGTTSGDGFGSRWSQEDGVDRDLVLGLGLGLAPTLLGFGSGFGVDTRVRMGGLQFG